MLKKLTHVRLIVKNWDGEQREELVPRLNFHFGQTYDYSREVFRIGLEWMPHKEVQIGEEIWQRRLFMDMHFSWRLSAKR